MTPVSDAEELEIVKGPPSPIYGGGKVGGYLNYTPKSARSTTAKWLEHPTGKVTFTYGSYDQKLGSVEFGSPFKLGQYRGGFYTFFSAQDSKSFYKGIATRDKLGQIAFDMELPHKWRMEAGMQGFSGSLPQNIGWNRVTQLLVDNGEYLAGSPAVNLAGNSYNLNPSNFQPGTLLDFAGYTQNFASDFLASPQAALFALESRRQSIPGSSQQQPDLHRFAGLQRRADLYRLLRPDSRFQRRLHLQEPDLLRRLKLAKVQHLWIRGQLSSRGYREQELVRFCLQTV